MRGRWAWPAGPEHGRVAFGPAAEGGWWHHRYAAFAGRLADRWRDEGLMPSEPQPLSSGESRDAAAALGEAIAQVNRPPGRLQRLRAANALERALLVLAESREVRPADCGRPAWMAALLDRLADAEGPEVDMAREADRMAMGHTTLRRAVRDATGLPPHAYRLSHKLAAARRLLAETDAPVKAVAARLGYHDVYHFSRHFSSAASACRPPPSDAAGRAVQSGHDRRRLRRRAAGQGATRPPRRLARFAARGAARPDRPRPAAGKRDARRLRRPRRPARRGAGRARRQHACGETRGTLRIRDRGMWLVVRIGNHILAKRLGLGGKLSGPDGMLEMSGGNGREPDVCWTAPEDVTDPESQAQGPRRAADVRRRGRQRGQHRGRARPQAPRVLRQRLPAGRVALPTDPLGPRLHRRRRRRPRARPRRRARRRRRAAGVQRPRRRPVRRLTPVAAAGSGATTTSARARVAARAGSSSKMA